MPSLLSLSRGFREKYLDHAEIEAQLRAWADAFPSLCRLSSIGTTHEGRAIWLLSVGPEPERRRPIAWVDGNMHASELCGSSVALAVAEDVLRLHLEPGAAMHELSAPARAAIHEVIFHVVPRMSPDGAEAVLKTGRWLRSVPRDERPDTRRARWVSGDLDGDGVALLMRKQDPSGELVEAKDTPGVLVERSIDDEGPFYKLYPEGRIEGFDGSNVPDPYFLSDNFPDLNRNFPFSWQPDPHQAGAGSFPTSEPEARAIVEHATLHPEIFVWLNLHTFGGVFIRPLGHALDSKMEPTDLAVFRQIAEWGERFTSYPTVSGFEEFTYEPDKPLHGDLTDYVYHQRGAIALVCELWDLFEQLGLPRQKRFVDRYDHIGPEEVQRLAQWDAEHNAHRAFRPWKRVEHPQLGPVDVGGFDPRVGIWNPPYERLAEVARGLSATFLRCAAMAPRLGVPSVEARPLEGGLCELAVTVENSGYLPTYVLASSKQLPWNEPVWLEVTMDGPELLTTGDERREVGHLEGWGQGKWGAFAPLHMPRTRGTSQRRTLRTTLRGKGEVVIRAGSCRVGWVEKRVRIG